MGPKSSLTRAHTLAAPVPTPASRAMIHSFATGGVLPSGPFGDGTPVSSGDGDGDMVLVEDGESGDEVVVVVAAAAAESLLLSA